MQALHSPEVDAAESDFLHAGVAILFSNTSATADLTEAEVQIIDTFFQSL